MNIDRNCIIVGDNGSGKTYFLQQILGLNKRKFEVYVNSKSIEKPYPVFGYHMQDSFLPENKTVLEILKTRSKNYEEIVDRFNLNLKSFVRDLSGGNKQLLSVLQSFLGKNEIVILDEPLNNLDESKSRLLMDWIKDQQKIVISTGHFNEKLYSTFPLTMVFEEREILFFGNTEDAFYNKDKKISDKFGIVFDCDSFMFRPEWTRFSQDDRYEPNCEILKKKWCGSYYEVEFLYDGKKYYGNHYTDKNLILGLGYVNFKQRIQK